MRGRERGPGAADVGLEKGELGKDEGHGGDGGEEVGRGVEEEEGVAEGRHDYHYPGDDGDGEEGDDVAGADDVEDEVASPAGGGIRYEVEHFGQLVSERRSWRGQRCGLPGVEDFSNLQ